MFGISLLKHEVQTDSVLYLDKNQQERYWKQWYLTTLHQNGY